MKFVKNVRFFQEGGPMPEEAMGPEGGMPAEGGAPMPEEGGAPAGAEQGGDQMQQMAGQLLDMLMQQIGDPNAVGAILETALQMLQEGAGGGAPQDATPTMQRHGGRLMRIG